VIKEPGDYCRQNCVAGMRKADADPRLTYTLGALYALPSSLRKESQMRHAALCLAMVAVSSIAHAGPPRARLVVEEMTPEQIAAAIQLGTTSKKLWPYGDVYSPASMTTPFLRVALAAHEAKREFKPFTAADVTPEMVEPELKVMVSPHVSGRFVRTVKAVVVRNKKTGVLIQPNRSTVTEHNYSNAYGKKDSGAGIVATFPLSVVDADNEIAVAYEYGDEGKQKFDVAKIR
jgi:hypothetical protein